MKTVLVLWIILLASSQCTKSNPTDVIPAKISGVHFTPTRTPVLLGKVDLSLYQLKIECDEVKKEVFLNKVTLNFTPDSHPDCIASLSVVKTGTENPLFGSSQNPGLRTTISGSENMSNGTNIISINFNLKSNTLLTKSFEVQDAELTFSDNQTIKVVPESKFVYRPTVLLRAAGQDQVNTYRIPGLATTNQGTLIAVYDIRYINSGDLQGDIDVGMSRSTDGGQSWEPMKKIMDMGQWGGKPNNENGIGDPCVLVDKATNIIWVAALWGHGKPGKSVWGNSGQGLTPEETGQFVLVKSDDDGQTWSEPINITNQVKRPEWYLFFQGPGNGITLLDGTLVFPAQFKDAYQIPNSTLIYSKDHGKTWVAGTSAKTQTTEAQIVQLTDGSLMLNMRDDRNRKDKGLANGRAVAITTDLGKTWIAHPSSNSALPESNCMASLISANLEINGRMRQVLFFSNPNSKTDRSRMTLKASLDEGLTWPEKYQVELNLADSYGYSCLTMVNENTVGILFEGTRDLYFQKIPVKEILKKH